MVPVAGQAGVAGLAVGVAVTVGLACLACERGRLRAWIIAGIGLAIALAAGPLGNWTMRYVMTKYGFIDGG